MSTSISTLSYALHTISAASPTPIGLGHTQQLVAAALGYKSLAAYQAAIAKGDESQHFDGAKHVVLNLSMLDARATDLNIEVTTETLTDQVTAAWKQCVPSAKLYRTESHFEDALRKYIDETVVDDESMSGEMAVTNNDGIGEIYIPFEFSMSERGPIGDPWQFELPGHVSMEIDTERPYSGHKINVEALLTLEQIGLSIFGPENCRVTRAKLDYGWGGNGNEDEQPKVSLAEALAELTGVTLAEAEELADADAMPVEGHDDALYGYIFDFTNFASPATAKKLMKQHGSLKFEVPSCFFEGVLSEA